MATLSSFIATITGEGYTPDVSDPDKYNGASGDYWRLPAAGYGIAYNVNASGKLLQEAEIDGPSVATASTTPTYPYLNLADYGADPYGLSDSTAAFNRAIDAALATPTGGGTIFGPPGKYKTTDTIALPGAVSFLGCGWGATYIVPTNTAKDVFALNVGGLSKAYHNFLAGFGIYPLSDFTTGAAIHLGNTGKGTFRDIKIDGSLGGKPYYCVQIDEASDTAFDNARCEGAVSDVYHLETQSGHTIVEVKWSSHCTIRNGGGNGVNVVANNTVAGGGGDIEGLHFDATDISVNTLAAIMLNAVGDQPPCIRTIHLKGTGIDTNAGGGIVTAGAGAIWMLEMIGLWISANGGDGVYLGSQVRDALLMSSTIRGNSHHGLNLDGLQRAVMGGMIVYDNSQAADLGYYGVNLNTGSLRLIGESAVYNTGGSTNRQNGVQVSSAPTNDILHNIRCSTGTGTTNISWSAPSSNRERATNLWDNDGSNTTINVKNLGSGTDASTTDGFGNASFSAQVSEHGQVPSTTTLTVSTTLSNTNEYVRINASSITASLPAANSMKAGQDMQFKNINAITGTILAPHGTDTIDGITGNNSTLLSAAKAKATLRSDGVSNWDIVG